MLITPGSGSHLHITFLRDDAQRITGFTVPRPSNFHAHLRKNALMRAIAKHLMRHVFYLLVMPNTGPILTLEQLVEYYEELQAIATQAGFGRLRLVMTLYYSALITPKIIEQLKELEVRLNIRIGIKWYPPESGATTGSGHGRPLEEGGDEFLAMADCRVPLLVHAESVVDQHGRYLPPLKGEAHFVEHKLRPFRDKNPRLRLCGEHATTREMVDFAREDPGGNTFITITPHGALCTVHDLDLSWGRLLKCKTTPNTEENRDAVIEFMVSGDPRTGAGDDTAAHLSRTKLLSFDRAANGAFWAEHSMPAYARVFNEQDALDDRYVHFTAFNAPDWWGLPRPETGDVIKFRRSIDDIPASIPVPEENDVVLPVGWSTEPDRMRIGLICEAV